MQINGNLVLNADGSGTLNNAYIEKVSSLPTQTVAGRIIYNTTTNAFYYYNGTAWEQFTAGSTSVTSFSAGSTGLTPATATTGDVVLAGILNPASGGTGVNNGANTITASGNITFGGAFTTTAGNNVTLTTTGPTNVTLPTSGTLATTANSLPSIQGFANGVLVNGVSTSVTGTNALLSFDSTVDMTNLTVAQQLEVQTAIFPSYMNPHGIAYVNASNLLVATNPPTAGQFLIGTGASSVPVLGTIVGGSGITVDGTSTPGTITVTNTATTTSVVGTANQIDVATAGGVSTVSLDPAVQFPGSAEILSTGALLFSSSGANASVTAIQPDNTLGGITISGTSIGLQGATTITGTLTNTGGQTTLTTTSIASLLNITGDLQLAGTEGTVGQVVTSNAGTTPSWTSVVNSAVAGTGISVSGATGAVTISNTATTQSVVGTANEIDVATAGGVSTLSLDSDLIVPGSLTVTSAGFLDIAGSLQLTGSTGTAGQVLASAGGTSAPTWLTPLSSITVTTPSGINVNGGTTATITTSGTFALTLTTNLLGLENLASTGFITQTGAGTFTNRAITGTAGDIVVTNGDGVAGSPTIDLAAVTQASSGNFVKVTLDGFGRVVGNTAVTQGDVTGVVGTYYLPEAGGSMTGNITFDGTHTVTGIPNPSNATDVASKSYVDGLVNGLSWKDPVAAAYTGSTAFTFANPFGTGLVIDGYTVQQGDRILVIDSADIASGSAGIWVATSVVSGGGWNVSARAADASSNTQLDDAAIFVTNGTTSGGHGYVQTGTVATGFTGQVWSQFTTAGSYTAGTGLTLSGSTFSVAYGAGIESLPSGEVGIDLYSTGAGALILTSDGSTSTTAAGSGLYLLLASGSGLSQSTSGLTIATAGVTNAMLANPSVPVDVDGAGSTTMTLGTNFNFYGTANRLVTSASANEVSFDISPNYVGQTSITTLGTVTSGTWTASTIGVGYGGTGVTTVPTNGQLLIGNGSGYTVGTLTNGTGISVTNGTGTITIANTGVTSFSAGTTGLTPASATTGDVVLAGVLNPANGGTGVANNNASTLTISGAFPTTFTVTAATSVTLPTSGTLLSSTTIATSAVTAISSVSNSQITVSGTTGNNPSTGVVTIGLPSTLVLPGNIEIGAGAFYVNSGGSIQFNGGTLYDSTTSLGTAGQVFTSAGTGSGPVWSSVVNSAVAGTGISVSGATGAVTISNTGVLSVTTTGAGISATTASGVVTLSNTGVTSFQTSLSGLTPATSTTGAVTLAGTLGVTSGGTGLTSSGALGNVIASTGSALASTPIQFVYSSALHGGASTSFTVSHSLNQQFVNVTVYDSSYNQIIPNSVVLTDANTVTVTVNSAINVFVVVMGVTGVAAA